MAVIAAFFPIANVVSTMGGFTISCTEFSLLITSSSIRISLYFLRCRADEHVSILFNYNVEDQPSSLGEILTEKENTSRY